MANYDNPNGFRAAMAGMGRKRITIGATAVSKGDVLGVAAGVAALYSATTHPAGPYCVAAEAGAAAAEIDGYTLNDGAEFIAQFDGTYAATSHDLQRFDLSGATGAQQVGTAQTIGTIQVLGWAPEGGSIAVGANARVRCRFVQFDGLPVPSARSSSVPAAAADTVTNTTVATAHAATKLLDVSELRVGDRLRVRAACKATSTNSTDTLAVTLKLGTVTLAGTTAADVANNDFVTFDGELEVKAIGASGFLQGFTTGLHKLGGTISATGNVLVSQAIDLSADIYLTLVETWSVASASNTVDLVELTLRRIPAGL